MISWVFYNGEPREVEAELENQLILKPTPSNSHAYAPKNECIELSPDEELILRDPETLTDDELRSALDVLAKDRMKVSDRPQSGQRKAKKKEPAVKVTGDILSLLDLTPAEGEPNDSDETPDRGDQG